MKKYNSNSISRNNKYNGAGGGAGGSTASDIAYDNSLSGLVSENVQQAIDELHDEIEIGNIYVADETKIGEWIDGSSIYRQIITLPSTVSGAASSWIDIADIPGVTKIIKCTIIDSTGVAFYPALGVKAADKIQIMHFRNATVTVGQVILEYLK